MSTFAQLVIAGLVTGTIYALIAAGYAVLYTATGFVNFALGAQAMFGGYFVYVFFDDLPISLRFVLAVIVSVIVAVASWTLLFRFVAERDLLAAIIMSFGFSIVLQEVVRVASGSAPLPAKSPFGSDMVEWGGVSVSRHGLAVMLIGGGAFLILIASFRSSRGTAARAMFQDKDMAEMLGIRTRRLTVVLFAVSGALMAVAGLLSGPLLSMSPVMGTRLALIAFVGAILGGLGRLSSAIAGALTLGLLEALFGGYVSADYRTTLVFGVLIAVLVARPIGIFGTVAKEKV
jgi:branched-chain amino acid transport system permease protein